MTPLLRYRNPGAAARWLCEAFGFREHDSAQESDQHVKYILLGLGDSCVLVRPVSNSVFDDLMVEPSAVGGANTHVLYVTIPDAEAHCTHAKSAGAKVELEPQDDGLGGRFYTCRDPEGHLWSFGTNRYGQSGSMPASRQADAGVPAAAGLGTASGAQQARPMRRRSLTAAAILAALAAGWMLYESYTHSSFEGTAMTTGAVDPNNGKSEPMAAEPGRRLAAGDVVASEAATRLEEERNRRLAAEGALADAAARLTDAAARLAEEREARLRAETTSAAAETKRAQDSTSVVEARQALQRLEADLARERREAAAQLGALQERLAQHATQTAQDKEAAARALTASQQLLLEHKSAAERARAELAAQGAQAANERSQQAAAAIAASAEAVAARDEAAQLERERAKQKEELEAAYTTLKAIRGELEALRAAQQQPRRVEASQPETQVAAAEPQVALAPLVVAPPPPARPANPCAQAVQGRVRLGPKGSRAWPEGSLVRLCHGAETSVEPARCFDELMRGKISWGTGNTWTAANALMLCAGTRNARQTLDCFATSIAANETWASAINNCRLAKQ
ncbi:MAG TPA: VOC family protein [Hyphomicrobiaceae bacterium]|jgi:uncharacterized glyoxalase superfamily protein PhnB|nr:VOC family protein [Hyphomicrobiaceae bacterium]